MSLELFFDETDSLYNPVVDTETRKRIHLCVYAYAYELLGETLVSDHEFDKLAYSINLKIKTRRPDIDNWFNENFEPHTGQWIWSHPEKQKLDVIAKRMIKDKK